MKNILHLFPLHFIFEIYSEYGNNPTNLIIKI